jgi:phage pi2 protein 07
MRKRRREQSPSENPGLSPEPANGEAVILERDEVYLCRTCDAFVAYERLKGHLVGRKHRSMEKIELYYSYLLQQGLSWMPGRKGFKCDRECCKMVGLSARLEDLENHVINKHSSTVRRRYPHVACEVHVGGSIPRLIYVDQGMKQTKDFWKFNDVESRAGDYQKISSPTAILSQPTKELMLVLVNGGFTDEDQEVLTSWALYLANHGDPVRKEMIKEGIVKGTRLVCHGMQYALGQIGR